MPVISKIKDRYYIIATSSVTDPFRLTLKDGDLFGVFDRFGDILPVGKKDQGLYYEGTRFLSFYQTRLNSARPLFLSSNVAEDNILMTVDLTNPDMYLKDRHLLKRDSAHILRSRILYENKCIERIRINNFSREPVRLLLDLSFDADFRDIFEIRGIKRKKRGTVFPPEYRDREIKFSYRGIDGTVRASLVRFKRKPDGLREKNVLFKIELLPGETDNISIAVHCQIFRNNKKKPPDVDFSEIISCRYTEHGRRNTEWAEIFTSNEQFNETLKRSVSDINMMLTSVKNDLYPYGGIPWFCTPFGRDGIITALECLWINPHVAKGVLTYLAGTQAKDFNRNRMSEPGKIMHEERKGEMAALNEIPFGLYYGSIDSTPLFVVLAGAYFRRTGDMELIGKIWRNIEDALIWMEIYGDIDGDGFIEYVPDRRGLRNQGWKDSDDSVFHKDGSPAEGPIALCEVQGYLYAAKKEAAALSLMMGKADLAGKLMEESEKLKEKFNRTFWSDSLGSYVLALDGKKMPCEIISSNAGHALFTGIADREKALKVTETLTSDKAFSGWGIRTVSAGEELYNPMSYHNGSVWPHDNAIISSGFSRYGLKRHSNKVFSGIFHSSLFMEFQRLPELFCGFHRRKGLAPTLYPVACSPQTWSSAAVLFMLQASLGIYFNAEDKKIIFSQPALPQFLEQVRINGLNVNEMNVDLTVRRYGEDVTVEILRKPEEISVQIIK